MSDNDKEFEAERIGAVAEAQIVELWDKFAVFGGPQRPFMLLPGFRQAIRTHALSVSVESEEEKEFAIANDSFGGWSGYC